MTRPGSLVVTGSLELQLDTLAERVARRVVELLDQRAAGGEVYDRPPDPDPGGDHRGARFGAVTEDGTEYDDPARNREYLTGGQS